MLVRSPTFTNSESASISSGSRPDRANVCRACAGLRGLASRAFAASARIWSGVVPQQPPIRLTNPSSMNSPTVAAICSGVSS